MQFHSDNVIVMNEIVNKFLLAGDKFMPKIYLKQPRFTDSASGPFSKNKEILKKFKETGDSRYIYRNEVDKACFQHDMAYGNFKNLPRGIASDKVLRDKAFNIAKNSKYDGYKHGLASMVYKSFDKKSTAVSVLKNMENKKLAEEFHKSIVRKFKKRKEHSSFKDNTWDADLADMQI